MRYRSSATTGRRSYELFRRKTLYTLVPLLARWWSFPLYAESSWSRAFACWRSTVSKPLVNHRFVPAGPAPRPVHAALPLALPQRHRPWPVGSDISPKNHIPAARRAAKPWRIWTVPTSPCPCSASAQPWMIVPIPGTTKLLFGHDRYSPFGLLLSDCPLLAKFVKRK